MGNESVKAWNVCMKNFLGQPQKHSFVMRIVFAFETCLVRPEMKCWYLWFMKTCALYVHVILLSFLTIREARCVTDKCSKHVTVCLEANEVTKIKVTVHSNNGNAVKVFVIQKNSTVWFDWEDMISLHAFIWQGNDVKLSIFCVNKCLCVLPCYVVTMEGFCYCEIRDAIYRHKQKIWM